MPGRRGGRTSRGGSRAGRKGQGRNEGAQYGRHAEAQKSFTMKDEARHTAHRGNPFAAGDRDSMLRSKPVSFISAGPIEPLKELPPVDGVNDPPTAIKKESRVADLASPVVKQEALQGTTTEANGLFFVDVERQNAIPQFVTSRSLMSHREVPTEARSEDENDEDVVLFRGRNNAAAVVNNSSSIGLDEIKIEITNVEHTLHKPLATPAASNATAIAQPQNIRRQSELAVEAEDDDDDAFLADYIANMAGDENESADSATERLGLGRRSFNILDHNLGGPHNELVASSSSSSASEDENDDEDDDDGASSINSAELEATLLREESLRADGEADVTGLGMDDETLAQLIAKQEELGLGGDELLLVSKDSPYRPSKKSRNMMDLERIGKKKSRESKSHEAISATAMADFFDQVTPREMEMAMSTSRSTNRRGRPIFNVSDPEMEASLNAAWEADRERKKERKVEREQKRVAGVLGKTLNPESPSVKYPTGLSLDQVKEEMRTFLCGSAQSLILPPMDAANRKIIHELANKFNIKSKSTGSGVCRRPALHRTKNTVSFEVTYYERIFARATRKYFHRNDVNAPKSSLQSKNARGGRGGNSSAYTYRDGEVVGGTAPELGEANRGRAILEKMGWSTGMALGAEHNQGILQPVTSVVKRSKAGLG